MREIRERKEKKGRREKKRKDEGIGVGKRERRGGESIRAMLG